MLKERVLTAIIGGALFLFLVYLGRTFALALSLILLAVCIYEIGSMGGFKPIEIILTIILGLAAFSFFLNEAPAYAFLFLLPVLTFGGFKLERKILIYLFLLYVSYAMVMLYIYARPPGTLSPLIDLLILTWSNDTIAYFAGLSFGKHKLAPRISPSKTIEGTLAGIIGSTLLFSLFNFLFKKQVFGAGIIMIGVFLALAAVLGDLLESYLKRNFGVKDSGRILPGHGGILDRFDSLMMVILVYTIINQTGGF
jgi:phosphatidate cytidylyltransferase